MKEQWLMSEPLQLVSNLPNPGQALVRVRDEHPRTGGVRRIVTVAHGRTSLNPGEADVSKRPRTKRPRTSRIANSLRPENRGDAITDVQCLNRSSRIGRTKSAVR